jgi:glycosyltransferase involved in cell wall biosynthesis
VRILILNWRDRRNPRAGGAEALTHELAKRLVERGHEIAWFTSRPAGVPAGETLDGVDVIRRGSEISTRFYAPRFARRSRFDVVVEEINTLPYLAPAWSRAPTVVFIPQLAREVWWYEAPRLLAPLGFAAEPLYLSAYRRTTAITISASTARDLRRVGVRGDVHVIPMAVATPALSKLPVKEPQGRLVCVARLVSSKRLEHAIEALARLRRDVPTATLTIVGSGEQQGALQRLASNLALDGLVTFTGRISDEEKANALQRCDVLVACSVREGWGLTVTEAARLGTPAVAYDVPGLRDSILSGRTGLLTRPTPDALASALRMLLDDRALYDRVRGEAWQLWSKLSWTRTIDAFERALSSAVAEPPQAARGCGR